MSNGNGEDKPQKITLTIEMNENGSIIVSGPIENEPISFWMLEKAKDTIKAHNVVQRMNKQPIIHKPHRIMNFIRGKH